MLYVTWTKTLDGKTASCLITSNVYKYRKNLVIISLTGIWVLLQPTWICLRHTSCSKRNNVFTSESEVINNGAIITWYPGSVMQTACFPANTRHWADVVLLLARRWPNIKTTSAQCLVLLAGHQWKLFLPLKCHVTLTRNVEWSPNLFFNNTRSGYMLIMNGCLISSDRYLYWWR